MKETPSFDLREFREHVRKYSPIYTDLLNCKERYLVSWGGAGSGKSHITARKILYRILEEENIKHNFLVARKVDRTIKRSVFTLIKNIINKWGLAPYFTINLTDKTMTFKPNGSQIMFTGLDDIEKLKSIEGVTGIWIEEATELLQEDFEQLDLRLRGETGTYKQIILTLNPISAENWIKKVFFDSDLPHVFTLKTTYLDNVFIDDEYKAVLDGKKITNPRYYNIYALGEWGTAEGLIFERKEVRLIKEAEVKGLECRVGIDFGYTNDPTALVITYYDKVNKRIFIYDGFYEKGLLNSQIAEKIKKLQIHKHVIYADSAEPKSIASIKLKGVPRIRPAQKGKDSINAGIDFLLDHEIIVNAHLVEVVKELNNYAWAVDKNGKATNKPIDDYNHALDAARYAYSDISLHRPKLGYIAKPRGI